MWDAFFAEVEGLHQKPCRLPSPTLRECARRGILPRRAVPIKSNLVVEIELSLHRIDGLGSTLTVPPFQAAHSPMDVPEDWMFTEEQLAILDLITESHALRMDFAKIVLYMDITVR